MQNGGERDSLVILKVFLLALFFLPSRLVVAGVGAAGRPALLVGLGALALWCMALLLPDKRKRRLQPMRWAVAIFVLVMGLAYLFGLDRGLPGVELRSADRELLLTLSLAGIALVAMDGIPTRAALDRVLGWLAYSTGAVATIGVVQFFTGFDVTRFVKLPGLVLNGELIRVGARGDGGIPRVAGTAGHYIEFGVVLGMLFPLVLHYARFATSNKERQWRWYCVGVVAVGIPFSVSRAGAVAVVIALLLASVGWTPRTKFNVVIAMLVMLVGLRVIKPGLIGTIKSLFLNVGNDPSVSGRTDDYALVGEFITDRPWLGRGLGTFLPDRYILLDNQWIGQVLSTGYAGAAAFALLFVTALALIVPIRHFAPDDDTRDLAQSLAAGVFTAGLTSFFFDSMSFAIFAGVLFFLFGCIGALWQVAFMPGLPGSTENADNSAHSLYPDVTV